MNQEIKFENIEIPAKFETQDCKLPKDDFIAIIPTFKSNKKSKLGFHCYYFYDFNTNTCTSIKVEHLNIMKRGFDTFKKANLNRFKFFPNLEVFFKSYHYEFNFFEEIMLMTVPHTVTKINEFEFIISLWSYDGYIVINLRDKKVSYRKISPNPDLLFLGSTISSSKKSNDKYLMLNSAKDSFKKISAPYEKVFSQILKTDEKGIPLEKVWSGDFADFMHDIAISDDERFLIACDMGRYVNENNQLIPSSLLIIDRENKKEWILRDIPNAAHVMFDLDDPSIIYFSNHNFRFIHTRFFELLKKGSYTIDFFGTASIHKYKISTDGPKILGVFEDENLYRMTNFHIFFHKNKKIIAAMGAPNLIFIIDPETLSLLEKIEVKSEDQETYIGTFHPTPDGEKLLIHTSMSFLSLDLETKKSSTLWSSESKHSCSNHMEVI
jgi:hypothetical protein